MEIHVGFSLLIFFLTSFFFLQYALSDLDQPTDCEVLRGVSVSLITLSEAVITWSKELTTHLWHIPLLLKPSHNVSQWGPHPLKFFHTLQGPYYRI